MMNSIQNCNTLTLCCGGGTGNCAAGRHNVSCAENYIRTKGVVNHVGCKQSYLD